jgi:AcrR family transcriptional regulator
MAKGRPAPGNGASSRSPAAPAAGPGDERDRIIGAMLACIARQGWRRLSLADIAAEAGMPILQLYRMYHSKTAILCGFFRRIDEAVLAAPLDSEPDERPRDRVFDLLMRRFDALTPHRDAIEALGRDLPADPFAALAAGAGLLRSMHWMLEAAGISGEGLGGAVAVKLTAGAYLATLRTWLRDNSPDLAPTMAALDRRLRGIERWYGGAGRRDRKATAPA